MGFHIPISHSSPENRQKEINECDSGPCHNGADCSDRLNDYYCECPDGYGGKQCDDPASACLSNPCHHGGTCNDFGDHYACDCPPGLTGCECESPIDLCESNPCSHDGTCINHRTTFECMCAYGHTGETCEDDEEVVDPVPAGDTPPLDQFMLTEGTELPNFDYEIHKGVNAEKCAEICLGRKNYLCRSFEIVMGGVCALQKHTPFTSGHFLHSNPDKQYYERVIPGNIECDFENQEICGYKPRKIDSTFVRFTGPTPAQRTGPEKDHTTGTGFYMYMAVKNQHPESLARLYSPISPPTDSTTLTFFYHNFGSGVERPLGGEIKVYIVPQDADPEGIEPIWTQQGSESPDWLKAQMQLSSRLPFQVVFEGIRGPTPKSEVAIDDVSISESPVADTINCNFEDPYRCGYRNDPSADFNWYWQDGPTPTPDTGPDEDHTTGTQEGHFMYAEPTDREPGQHARVFSPVNQPYNGPFEFFYHMDCGGTLNIFVVTGDGEMGAPIWSKQGDFGKEWFRGVANVVASEPFKLAFEAVRGESDCSDVAFDDVRIPDPGEILPPEDEPQPCSDSDSEKKKK
ncbi:MAM and LDL-receptor class A domain-containing protein 1-like [Saccoglossus kowalevskii]